MIDFSWICAAGALTGNFLLAKRRKVAIIVLLCSATLWIIWAVVNGVWSIVALNCIYVLLHIRTIYYWHGGYS